MSKLEKFLMDVAWKPEQAVRETDAFTCTFIHMEHLLYMVKAMALKQIEHLKSNEEGYIPRYEKLIEGIDKAIEEALKV